jgi:hypothetical protein
METQCRNELAAMQTELQTLTKEIERYEQLLTQNELRTAIEGQFHF